MSYITEEAAREKWCPMASHAAKDTPGGGTYLNGEPAFNCIGSACMMWRWMETWNPVNQVVWPAPEATCKISTTHGRCGFAR